MSLTYFTILLSKVHAVHAVCPLQQMRSCLSVEQVYVAKCVEMHAKTETIPQYAITNHSVSVLIAVGCNPDNHRQMQGLDLMVANTVHGD